MRYIFLICLILIIENSFAQNKWSIGVVAGPNLSAPAPFKGTKHNIKLKPGVDFGFTAYKKLSKYFYFNTGFIIGKKHYLNDYQADYYSEGNYVGTFINHANAKFTDINIPVNLNFKFPINDKLFLLGSAGISLGWIVKTKTENSNIYFNQTDEYNRGFSFKRIDNVYLSGGIGLMYNLNNKLSVIVQPTLMRDIKQSNFDLLIDYSLRCSLLYNL